MTTPEDANTVAGGSPVERGVRRLVEKRKELGMLKLKHLDRALQHEQMLDGAAWKAANEPPQTPRWRRCEFCRCQTNARLRACCDKGRDADRKTPNASLSGLPREEG